MKYLMLLVLILCAHSVSADPVLVTGFGPFGRHEQNISSLVVEHIAQYREDIITAVIPVDWEQSAVFASSIDPGMIRGVIALGIDEGITDEIILELQAYNRTSRFPDTSGKFPPDHGEVVPGAPELLKSPAAEQMASHFPVSRDPGGYLCGWFYYLLLHHLENLPVVFLHIPPEMKIDQAVSSVLKMLDLLFPLQNTANLPGS